MGPNADSCPAEMTVGILMQGTNVASMEICMERNSQTVKVNTSMLQGLAGQRRAALPAGQRLGSAGASV